MDKAQIKIISLTILFFVVFSLLVYAISISLTSPVNQFVDDDGFLDLRGKCFPSDMNGTTSWNITNATLYAKIGSGSWLVNKTLQAINPRANITYLFNFTNDINSTADNVDVIWNIQCQEQMELGSTINTAFTANQTVQVRYASALPSITTLSDNSLDTNGKGMNFTGLANPSDSSWNITIIELYTNVSGPWKVNATYTISPIVVGQTPYFNFSDLDIGGSLPDASRIVWSIATTQSRNITGVASHITELNKTFFTSNRTLLVEYPPTVRLIYPTDGSWETTANSVLNFTANSTFISGTGVNCQLHTNETGTWLVQRTFAATNGTVKNVNYQFPDGLSDVRWSVFCSENTDSRIGNFSVNNTVRVDRTLPIPTLSLINLSSPVNNSFFSTFRLIINYTLTDNYPNSCDLYVNNTRNTSSNVGLNAANLILNATEGVYLISIGCNDTAGNYVNQSANYWVNPDQTYPTFSGIGNKSVSGYADQRLFFINISELANLTIYYGSTTATTSSVGNSTFISRHNLTVGGFAQNTVYYFNLTACDRAGNCNRSGPGPSLGQFNFTYPYKLLTGWSYYGVYDAIINFSRILNETEAEFVYYWNQTAQKWVSAQAGGSSNMDFQVGTSVGERAAGGRHVIAIFESTNSTWQLRNTSSPIGYTYNLTTGDNFIKLWTAYTFGNLSLSFFNTSHSFNNKTSFVSGYSFNVEQSNTPGNVSLSYNNSGGLPYNLTDFFFSAYNNTANTWEPYYVYNGTPENGTVITPRAVGDNGNMEVVWVFSRLNLTYNGTNIIGNWTY